MIEDYIIRFEDYKSIDAINYSLLKSVADSGHLYSLKEKKGDFLDMGKIVEDLLIPIENDRNQYHYLNNEKPTATTLVLADLVIEYCEQNNLDFKKLKELDDNEEIIYKIVDDAKLWPTNKEETRKKNYKDNKSFWEYIKASLALKEGKVLVTPQQWEKANELSNILKFHKFTKNYFNKGLNQVTWKFTIAGNTYKIRLDKLIIDDAKKTIQPVDLKTGWPEADSFERNFYKFRYYLQGGLYSLGTLDLAKKLFPNYKVLDFKFIFISTTTFKPYPTIWNFSEKWAELAYYGFEKNGRKYKGIKELTEELKFYEKNGKDLPIEVYKNNGNLSLELPN